MDHKESAQMLMDAMRIYHNYVRKHQGLDGKTPAEASGIKLALEGNRIEKLVRAAKTSEKSLPVSAVSNVVRTGDMLY